MIKNFCAFNHSVRGGRDRKRRIMSVILLYKHLLTGKAMCYNFLEYRLPSNIFLFFILK